MAGNASCDDSALVVHARSSRRVDPAARCDPGSTAPIHSCVYHMPPPATVAVSASTGGTEAIRHIVTKTRACSLHQAANAVAQEVAGRIEGPPRFINRKTGAHPFRARPAAIRLADHAARLADHAGKLTLLVDQIRDVLAEADDHESKLLSTLNIDEMTEFRRQMPCFQDRSPGVYQVV